ncbi:ribonuclease E/G [Sandarakinorhabdus limnophila]|uniref:ribonuclease E/G n=1 Tax=Sandarakinorhabdus limnophila TaxID=210512 RepID=UPI0026EAD322|nr:ribonuclease E/G [Sandarakinorhabdus limnophila]MCM0033453.1 ribonuclease E/G [Sandarakinorhabdus limnophila]
MIALVEAAPGATRALVLDGDTVVEAHIARADDPLPVGLIAPARLADRRQGVAVLAAAEAQLAPVPADWPEGQTRLVEVLRPARPDGVRDKQARVAAHDGPARPAPDLATRLATAGHAVTPVPAHGPDVLADSGWDAVVEEALSGRVEFPGGRLLVAPTPAMLVIDVDGTGDLARLAEAAARAVAALIRRHGIGGPVVVDFPSLGGRAPRAVVDTILAETLPPPFERTAMNGFGLVQIIRPRRQLSLIENVRQPGFAALELLRRAQRLVGPVQIEAQASVIDWLAAHPALIADCARLTGGTLALQARDGAGRGHVQPV